MSKWLAVVALVLLVLSGAMGLRNLVVANAPTVSALNSSSLAPQQLIPCNLGEWPRSDSADTTTYWWSRKGEWSGSNSADSATYWRSRKGEWSGSNSADSATYWRSLRANGPGPIPPILPPGPGH